MAGKSRLESADHLYEVEGSSPAVVELLQEAVERSLKAYLILRKWTLVRTHDLNRLVAEATKHDARFAAYHRFTAQLTEQFWEQHYPGGDLSEVGSDYAELRCQAGEMTQLILAAFPPELRERNSTETK